MNGAGMMVMKMLVQSKMSSMMGGGGNSGGGMSSMLGLVSWPVLMLLQSLTTSLNHLGQQVLVEANRGPAML